MSPPAQQRAERIARDGRITPHVAPLLRGADSAGAPSLPRGIPLFANGRDIALAMSSPAQQRAERRC